MRAGGWWLSPFLDILCGVLYSILPASISLSTTRDICSLRGITGYCSPFDISYGNWFCSSSFFPKMCQFSQLLDLCPLRGMSMGGEGVRIVPMSGNCFTFDISYNILMLFCDNDVSISPASRPLSTTRDVNGRWRCENCFPTYVHCLCPSRLGLQMLPKTKNFIKIIFSKYIL